MSVKYERDAEQEQRSSKGHQQDEQRGVPLAGPYTAKKEAAGYKHRRCPQQFQGGLSGLRSRDEGARGISHDDDDQAK